MKRKYRKTVSLYSFASMYRVAQKKVVAQKLVLASCVRKQRSVKGTVAS